MGRCRSSQKSMALATFLSILLLCSPLFVMAGNSQSQATPYSGWFHEGWKIRIPVEVSEPNGIRLSPFVVDFWLDTSRMTVYDVEKECRVTFFDVEKGIELEVEHQVIDVHCNGTHSLGGRVLFLTLPMEANSRHTYFVYLENSGVEKSQMATDFNPDLIRNRLLRHDFSNSDYHLGKPVAVDVGIDGMVYVSDRVHSRIQVFDHRGIFQRSIGGGDSPNSLKSPAGIAVTSDRIYVVDEGNNRIQVYDLSGSYIASLGITGVYGSNMSTFSSPKDVAVGKDGRVYVADYNNHRIQVFNDMNDGIADWTIGKGFPGMDYDAFHNPIGIVVTVDRIFVADSNNHRVSTFSLSGDFIGNIGITGIRGSNNSMFSYPRGVSVANGNLLVADYGNHRIQIFDMDGEHVRTMGEGAAGSGQNQLRNPYHAVFGETMIYVADYGNDRIQVFNDHGRYVRTLGRGWVTPGEIEFFEPRSVSVGSDGLIVVGDRNHHRIQIFNPDLSLNHSLGVPAEAGSDGSHFNLPVNVLLDEKNLYVVDEANDRVQVFDRNWTLIGTIGGKTDRGPEDFNVPKAVAVGSDGRIYVCDTHNNRVQVFYSNMTYSETLGSGPFPTPYHIPHPHDVEIYDGLVYVLLSDSIKKILVYHESNLTFYKTLLEGESGDGSNQLNRPTGFSINNGIIAIGDTLNNRVQIINTDGSYVGTIGRTGVVGLEKDLLQRPRDTHITESGDIYVADGDNNRIQIFGLDLAHKGTLGYNPNFVFDNHHLYKPAQIAVDAQQSIYIADEYNHRVQMFNAKGEYIGSIGSSTSRTSGDDDLHLFGPKGVAVSDGRIFVADSGNSRVQVYNSNLQLVSSYDIKCYSADIDSGGNVYFTDTINSAIHIYAPASYLGRIGEEGVSGNDLKHLSFPRGVSIGKDGKVFVADSNNHRVLAFENYQSEYASLVIGQTGVRGIDNHHFNNPTDVLVSNGALYVVDNNNNRIQVFTVEGIYVETIGVTGAYGCCHHGTSFFCPTSIAMDSEGRLYISDTENGRIMKITDADMSLHLPERFLLQHEYSAIPLLISILLMSFAAGMIVILLLVRRKGQLPPTGFLYRVEGKSQRDLFHLAGRYIIQEKPLFIVSKTKPEIVLQNFQSKKRSRSGKPSVPRENICWLSGVSSEGAVSPTDVNRILFAITRFAEKNPGGVVTIDGIEYIATQVSFERVIELVNSVSEVAPEHNMAIFLLFNSEAYGEKEAALIKQVTEELPIRL